MRNSTKKKIISAAAIIIVIMMIIAVLAPIIQSSAQSTDSSLDSQYETLKKQEAVIEKQQKELASQKSSNKASQAVVKAQINNINQNMSVIKQQIDLLDNKINDCTIKIKTADTKIAETQKRIVKNTELYKERIRILYETGSNVSRIQVLLSSKNISEFLSRYEIMKMISEHDTDLINQLGADKKTIVDQKAVIVGQRQSLLFSQNQFKSKKSAYESQAVKVNKLYSKLKDRAHEISAHQDALEAAEASANSKIEKIIKEKQEEARREAEQNGSSYNYTGGTWLWPIQNMSGQYISSGFGPRAGHVYPHTGIDIAAGDIYGHPILASNSGTVIIAGYDDSGIYGNYVVIDHGGGMTTLYGHSCQLNCSVGDVVKRGQVIGYVGSTGNSTGPHLHFQIMKDGTAINPLNYVKEP